MKINKHKTFIEGHTFEEILGRVVPEKSPKVHLSHGLNDLPIPEIMKTIMINDIKAEGFRNYADLDYDNLLCGLIIHHHNFMTGNQLSWRHCNVIESSTYALNCVVSYVRGKSIGSPKALVVGLNYYLIYEILNQSGFEVCNMFSDNCESPQPDTEMIVSAIERHKPAIFILSQPSNPSGEVMLPSDLLRVSDVCRENVTFIVLDRICADLESENKNHFTQPFLSQAIVDDHIAIIDGITKRRSCGGIRTAFVLGSLDLMDYIDYRNETMIFYPPFLGIKVMIAEYLFQILILLSEKEKLSFEEAFAKAMKAVIDIAEKPSKQGKFMELIDEIIPPPYKDGFERYTSDTRSVKASILANEAYFKKAMCDLTVSITTIQSGFSFAAILKNEKNLIQEQFCRDLYKRFGVYLYPDVYFGSQKYKHDTKFWIRIGCALPCDLFREGVNRLSRWMKELGNGYAKIA